MAVIALSDLRSVGGGLETVAIDSATTLENKKHYLVSLAGTVSGLTLTMPAGEAGAVVRFTDSERVWGSKPLTLLPNGADTFGPSAATGVILDSDWQFAQFMWNDQKGWWDRDDALNATIIEELSRYSLISTATTLTPKGVQKIVVDTSGSAFQVDLPGSPQVGDVVQVADAQGSFSTNNLTIDGNGNNILGAATFTISTNYANPDFIWVGGANGWTVRA